jgi:antibiotic biosynthesis monooxygenase (ABM) superfamily enzyme
MPTHPRFSPTEPRTPIERWVMALLTVVVLLPVVGVLLMLATGGAFFGVTLGDLGEVPAWMAAWLVLGSVLLVLVAVWMAHMVLAWLTKRRV